MRGFVFSPISLAVYFFKQIGVHGLLATSGDQIRLSFSKVRRFLFLPPPCFS